MGATTEAGEKKKGKRRDVSWDDVKGASAKKDAEANRKKHAEKFKPRALRLMVPVQLTDAERLKIGAEAAKLDEKRKEQESEKKAAADKWKSEIELTEQAIAQCLASLRKGTEDREVECVETFLFDTNTVEVRRTDTGQVHSTRAMKTEERQEEMFPDEKVAGEITDPADLLDAANESADEDEDA